MTPEEFQKRQAARLTAQILSNHQVLHKLYVECQRAVGLYGPSATFKVPYKRKYFLAQVLANSKYFRMDLANVVVTGVIV